MREAWGPGCHGKVPSRGDFVGVGLPPDFLDRWDEWLARGIGAAQRAHGTGWRTIFTEAPVWRFAFDHGVCGLHPVVGVLVPSADRVHRQYPFVVVGALDLDEDAAAMAGARHWFERAEALALTARSDRLSADALEPALAFVGRPSGGFDGRAAVEERLGVLPARFSLWWTRGTAAIPPSILVTRGLPAPEAMTALIDGDWDRWGWTDLGVLDAGR